MIIISQRRRRSPASGKNAVVTAKWRWWFCGGHSSSLAAAASVLLVTVICAVLTTVEAHRNSRNSNNNNNQLAPFRRFSVPPSSSAATAAAASASASGFVALCRHDTGRDRRRRHHCRRRRHHHHHCYYPRIHYLPFNKGGIGARTSSSAINNNHNNNAIDDDDNSEDATVSATPIIPSEPLLLPSSLAAEPPPATSSYQGRSTSPLDGTTAEFHEGSEDRRRQLHAAMAAIGLDVDELLQLTATTTTPSSSGDDDSSTSASTTTTTSSSSSSSPSLLLFQGCTAAARAYASFVIPKSEGALAMTRQPGRAAYTANHVSFLLREHRSHTTEWLRNHDKSIQEAEDLWRKKEKRQQQLSSSSTAAVATNSAAAAATTTTTTTTSKTDDDDSLPVQLRHPVTLILDNVRSAHNVGNILRAAEAARVKRVVLAGSMTPAPPHNKAVLKTALGAASYVPYRTSPSALQAIRDLKDESGPSLKVYGVETTSRSVPLWETAFFSGSHVQDTQQQEQQQQEEVAFVFGNELVGVDIDVLEECNGGLVAVPTHGIKNSLNVATCASIVTWEALRQWENLKKNARGYDK